MKKIVSFLTAAALTLPGVMLCTGCAKREELLRIYNWGDYIDEEGLIFEFEDWYKEQTGKTVVVDYETFDTNEDMIMRIEVQHVDYDLVCPSDYMAERMIESGLVREIDRSVFDITSGVLYDGLPEMVQTFDPENKYFVPYIWGTLGLLYNTDKIEPGSEDVKSWNIMWSEDYAGKIIVKDSVRDAYSMARIYANMDKLSELSDGFTDYNAAYKAELDAYFDKVSEASLKEAQAALMAQKPVVYKYETDNGKDDIINGNKAWVGLFWSCDAGWAMNDSDNLYYEVPKEGSNVWVDGWVIPKYAKNVEAANYFLKFINTHEFARINYDYLCASIASKSVMEEVREEIEEDDEFYADAYEGFKEMYLEMMFPSEETLSRCGVMRDFGKDMSTKLDGMWIDVKTA